MRKALSVLVPVLLLGASYATTDAASSVGDPGVCPPPFTLAPASPIPFGRDVDRNDNDWVCVMTTRGGEVVTIDDRIVR